MREPVTDFYAYGGQAVVEGVMMRGRREMAVAVRAPSGEIVVWSEPVRPSRLARRVRDWRFVRGAVLLWDTMALGIRALVFSAAVGARPVVADNAVEDEHSDGAAQGPALWLMLAVSILFAIGLFFVLPLAGAAVLDRWIDSSFVSNLVEGLIRLGVLIAYIHAISYLPDVQRVFAYHGAEHKTIHAWEAGDPLEVASVRRHPLEHPRCGTGFLLIVMLLAFGVFLLLGRPDLPLRIASRIVFVPLVAGVAYEILKFGGRYASRPLSQALLQPGMKLQRLTTREPDDSMIDVAIAALLRVLLADGRISDSDPRLASVRQVDATARPLDRPFVRPVFEPAAAD